MTTTQYCDNANGMEGLWGEETFLEGIKMMYCVQNVDEEVMKDVEEIMDGVRRKIMRWEMFEVKMEWKVCKKS